MAAAIVHKAVGDQLVCVFVDHGLLRQDERRQVEEDYVKATGIRLVTVDAREQFLTALAGVSDPETKRKIIGREFIRTFEQAERDLMAEAEADGEPIKFVVFPKTSSLNSWSLCEPSSRMRCAPSAASWVFLTRS